MKKTLLMLGLVAVSAGFVASEAAAQFRGGRGGRGGSGFSIGIGNGYSGISYGSGYGGYGNGYGGYGNGFYGNGYGGYGRGYGYGNGYYGNGLNINLGSGYYGSGYGGNYYGSGYGGNYYGGSPYYSSGGLYYDYSPSYSTPTYSYGPEYYSAQAPSMNTQQSFYNDPNSATLTVMLPVADAQVWFDDTPTSQRGMERSFHTPALQQPGTYTIKARWNDNGRTVDQQRKITVRPGQSVMVDFRSERVTNPNTNPGGTNPNTNPGNTNPNPNPGTTNPNPRPVDVNPNANPRPNDTPVRPIDAPKPLDR